MRATALSQVALSSKIIDWSEEQMVPLSKVLEAMTLFTATLRLADLETKTGVLPGPTPMAGWPELYADLTMAPPPVARTRLTPGCLKRALVASIEGSSIH